MNAPRPLPAGVPEDVLRLVDRLAALWCDHFDPSPAPGRTRPAGHVPTLSPSALAAIARDAEWALAYPRLPAAYGWALAHAISRHRLAQRMVDRAWEARS